MYAMPTTNELNFLGLLTLAVFSIPVAGPAQTNEPADRAVHVSAVAPSQTPNTSRGSDKTPITILIFSDFESFPCARSASVLAGVLGQNRDVRLIFKHAPAATNPNALLAHEAAVAAGAQGKFWEMHDTLFENQTKLSRADLIEYAKRLGLSLPAFQQALDSHIYRPIIERDLAEAKALGAKQLAHEARFPKVATPLVYLGDNDLNSFRAHPVLVRNHQMEKEPHLKVRLSGGTSETMTALHR